MTTKPKTKEEAAKEFADEVTEGVGMPAKARASFTLSYREAFLAGCEFVEQQLKETDGAYRLGHERGLDDGRELQKIDSFRESKEGDEKLLKILKHATSELDK